MERIRKKNKYLLVKYEDLVDKKKSTMLKIFKFLDNLGLKVSIDMVKLNKAIKSTDFDKMKMKKETFMKRL